MEMGLRIPQDMALFCHDDSAAFTTHCPTISYVSQSSDKLGTQAYLVLRDMIAGKGPRKEIIAPELFYGGSSAAR